MIDYALIGDNSLGESVTSYDTSIEDRCDPVIEIALDLQRNGDTTYDYLFQATDVSEVTTS